MSTPAKPNLRSEIASSIRKARLRSDKTMKEVAAALQITPQAYSKIERGEVEIPFSRLVILASVLNASINEFVPSDYNKK